MRFIEVAILGASVWVFGGACQKQPATEAKNTESSVQISSTGNCEANPLPDITPASGQITFTISDKIDPCSVSGYIVGYPKLLKVEIASNGTYYINNIPSGSHDVVILANSSTSMRLDERKGSDRGVRLNNVDALNGVRNEVGVLKIPMMGSLSGIARLIGQSHQIGTDVYIPGTDLIAKTDDDGNFSLTSIPAGNHNIYFEHEGYHRGQLEDIDVMEGEDVITPNVDLAVSTGAEGFLIIASGEETYNSRTAPLTIGATPDAVLMKLSENESFLGARWEPLRTSSLFTFDSEGKKTLWIKFANENGLESSPFNAEITIKLFPDALSSLKVEGGEVIDSRSVKLIMETPENAIKMKVDSSSGFSNSDWVNSSGSFLYTLPNVGPQTVYLKFKDADDFESPVYNTAVNVQLFPPCSSINPQVNNGVNTSTSRTVTLTNLVPKNASSMRVGENSDIQSGSWISPSTSSLYGFTSEGDKTLFLRFKDKDGFVSDACSAGIKIDIWDEALMGLVLDGGSNRTNADSITAAITYPTNAAQMALSLDMTFASASWESVANTKNIAVPRGGNTVYVKFRDSDGLESSVINASIYSSNFSWTSILGRNAIDRSYGNGLALDSNGKINVLSSETVYLSGSYKSRGKISKFDISGNIFQSYLIDSTSLEAFSPRTLVLDGSDNTYVAGKYIGSMFGGNTSNSWDAFILKFGTDYTALSQSNVSGDSYQDINNLIVDSSGNSVVCGEVATSQKFIAKYDASGSQLWYTSIAPPVGYSGGWQEGCKAVGLADGGYLIQFIYSTFISGTQRNAPYIMEISSSGVVEWQFYEPAVTNTSAAESNVGLFLNSSGLPVVVASDRLITLTSGGAVNSTIPLSFSVSSYGSAKGICVDPLSDSLYFVGGGYSSLSESVTGVKTITNDPGSAGDAFISKYSSNGSLVWTRILGARLTGNAIHPSSHPYLYGCLYTADAVYVYGNTAYDEAGEVDGVSQTYNGGRINLGFISKLYGTP